MSDDVKRIDVEEFRSEGYLQEANRLFFHPLGLALEVVVGDDGSERLGGVWDYRDDPEGIYYGHDLLSGERASHVADLLHQRSPARRAALGWVVQPADDE